MNTGYIHYEAGNFHYNKAGHCINAISQYYQSLKIIACVEVAIVETGSWCYGMHFKDSGHTLHSYIDYFEQKRLHKTKAEAFNNGVANLVKYITAFNGRGQYDNMLLAITGEQKSNAYHFTTDLRNNQYTLF